MSDLLYIDLGYYTPDGYFVRTASGAATVSGVSTVTCTGSRVVSGQFNADFDPNLSEQDPEFAAQFSVSTAANFTASGAANLVTVSTLLCVATDGELSDIVYIQDDYFEPGYFVRTANADAVFSSALSLDCAGSRARSGAVSVLSTSTVTATAVSTAAGAGTVTSVSNLACAAAKTVSAQSIQLSAGAVSLQARVTSSASTDLSADFVISVIEGRVQSANITLETIVSLSLQADKLKGTAVDLTAASTVQAAAIRYISTIPSSPTPFRARGQALISTAQTRYGTHSLHLPDSTASAITTSTHTKFNIPNADTTDAAVGAASRFAISLFFRPTATTAGTFDDIISFGAFNTPGWRVLYNSDRRIVFQVTDAANNSSIQQTEGAAGILTTNDWHYIQISRDWIAGGNRGRLSISVNGVETVDVNNFNRDSGSAARNLIIGNNSLGTARGFIDGVRVEIGNNITTITVPSEDLIFGTPTTQLLMNWNDNVNGNWFDQSLSTLETGAAALSSTVSVAAVAVKTAQSTVTLSSTVSVTAQGTANITADADLVSTATATASARRFAGGSAALSSTVSLTAEGLDLDLASADLSAITALSVTADRTRFAAAAVESTAEQSTTATKTVSSTVTLSAQGFVLNVSLRLRPGVAELTAVSTLTCEALKVKLADAVLTSQFDFTATANRSFPRPLDLTLSSTGFSLDTNTIYSNIRFVEFEFGVNASSSPNSQVTDILVLGNQFTVQLEYQAAPNRNYLRLNGVRAAGTQGEDGDLALPPSGVAVRTVRIVKTGDVWTLTSTGAPGTITVSRTQADAYSGSITANRPSGRSSSMAELVFAGPTASLVNLVSSNPFVFSDQSNIQGLYHSPYVLSAGILTTDTSDDVSIRQLGNAALATISQLNVAPIYNLGFAADLLTTSTIAVTPRATLVNSAAIGSESQVTCANQRSRSASSQALTVSDLICTAATIKGSAVALNAAVSVTTTATATRQFEIVTDAVASQLTVAVKTGRTLVTLESSSTVTVTARKRVEAALGLNSISTVLVTAAKRVEVSAAVTANSELICDFDRIRLGAAAFVSTSTTTTTAVLQARGISNMLSVSVISANPFGIFEAFLQFNSVSTVTAVSIITARGVSTLQSEFTQISNINRLVGFECVMSAFNSVLAIGTRVTIDPYYQIQVPRELRVRTVTQETGILTADSENRLNTVQAHATMLIVPSETKILSIPFSPVQGIRRIK